MTDEHAYEDRGFGGSRGLGGDRGLGGKGLAPCNACLALIMFAASLLLMPFVVEARPVQAAAPASVAAKGDRDLGEYLAAECATCHQPGPASSGIPPISGRPEADFIAVMKEYRHRARPNPVMQMIASRLSEEEIASLALYFGSLTSSQ